MSRYEPDGGYRCQGCGAGEARCAFKNCQCCEACTHTFDGGATARFLCWGCCRVITVERISGPMPTTCRLCQIHRYQGVA